MTILDVEKQRFEFGKHWTLAFKYDSTAYYRQGPEKMKGEVEGVPQSMRAVDIVARYQPSGFLLLLEAKDFRGFRIENKLRIKTDDLATEIACKVKDTISGLVGAHRKLTDGFPDLEELNRAREIRVVLWMEDDLQKDTLSAKQQLNTLTQSLKFKLKWLNVHVFALSSKVPNKLPSLTVSNLARVVR